MFSWLNKRDLRIIIFGTSTPAGKNFDIALLIVIIASVLVVLLETVPSLNDKYHILFLVAEILFTLFFTLEYIARIYSAPNRWKYITSFFGIIDLVSILPAFLGFFLVSEALSLTTVRAIRLLRVFRIFKMMSFMKEGRMIITAMRASLTKLSVFIFFVLVMVLIFGSLMYLIEGHEPDTKFDSIPRSIYWAIVTLTTVGYGDISPTTSLGQFISAIVMIMGYAVIAVPTGIVSADLVRQSQHKVKRKVNPKKSCPSCEQTGHEFDSKYCRYCGTSLTQT